MTIVIIFKYSLFAESSEMFTVEVCQKIGSDSLFLKEFAAYVNRGLRVICKEGSEGQQQGDMDITAVNIMPSMWLEYFGDNHGGVHEEGVQ